MKKATSLPPQTPPLVHENHKGAEFPTFFSSKKICNNKINNIVLLKDEKDFVALHSENKLTICSINEKSKIIIISRPNFHFITFYVQINFLFAN